jgi:hypothetical protein
LTLHKLWMSSARVAAGAALVILIAAACSISGDKKPTVTAVASPTSSATPIALNLASPSPVGPAPTPGTVDASKFVMIDQWRTYQVPTYPGATVGSFTQLGATAVQNGGSLVLTTTDSAEQVLAYYRGALPFLGWKEITANAQKVSFRTDKASITVSATSANGSTAILLILGDV